jgi:hypothetical protein
MLSNFSFYHIYGKANKAVSFTRLTLSVAMTVASTLSFSNTASAQTSNLEKIGVNKQEILQVAKVNTNKLPTQNSSCLQSNGLKNSPKTLLAELILDSRPSYDSKCGDYYTTYKNGNHFDCIRCVYSTEPYCWHRYDLDRKLNENNK